MSDANVIVDLVSRAIAGDEGAWTEIVVRYQPLVASVITPFRLQLRDAEDVNQTVWLRLVERLGALREPRALPGWIATTVRNECIEVLRTSRRTIPVDPVEGFSFDNVLAMVDFDGNLTRAERSAALLEAFAELPARERSLVMLLIADPVPTYAQIAEQLDIPLGSIGPTRARVLNRIRAHPAILALQDRVAVTTEGGCHD
jgi:RNA polymerase sigma factor (sigma-70 family)